MTWRVWAAIAKAHTGADGARLAFSGKSIYEKENSDFKPGTLGRSKGSSGYLPGSWPPNLPAFAQRATGDTSAVSFLRVCHPMYLQAWSKLVGTATSASGQATWWWWWWWWWWTVINTKTAEILHKSHDLYKIDGLVTCECEDGVDGDVPRE